MINEYLKDIYSKKKWFDSLLMIESNNHTNPYERVVLFILFVFINILTLYLITVYLP